MQISRFEIRVYPYADFVVVEPVFIYSSDGRETASPKIGNALNVGRPNIIDKLFGISWHRKVEVAKQIVTKRAEQRLKKEKESEQIASSLGAGS